MATDNTAQVFAGISNENEFYGHHYLAEVFKGDIRDRLDHWQTLEAAAKVAGQDWRSPQRQLAGAGGRWFRDREKLRHLREPAEFQQAFVDLQRPLLALLGYAIQPDEVSLNPQHPIRTWQQFATSTRAPQLLVIPAADYRHPTDDILDQPIDLSVYPADPP
ncbi:MAG: hypothetical protein KDI48_20005, partial [Xanthomonadales bacterium]|nr:hypothetical protein [Xanthomonadales bacterium]